MKKHSLCVLPADKEGSFAIMSLKMYREKACRTVSALFNCHAEVSTKKLKSKAKSLLRKLNLVSVLKNMSDAKEDFLEAFFSAKTHKVGMPFRLIVSENNTWQKCIALYLQKTLKYLEVNDPFLVKSSCEVQEFISSRWNKTLFAFSVDVKDL